jgi:hypothetical protein
MALQVDGLAEAMEDGFKKEWQRMKGFGLPAAGLEDRRVLFAGIARGILEYLKDHEDEMLKTITFEETVGRITHSIVETDLNFSKGT